MSISRMDILSIKNNYCEKCFYFKIPKSDYDDTFVVENLDCIEILTFLMTILGNTLSRFNIKD